MNEIVQNKIVQDVALVILGAFLALVGTRLLEWYKERKQRQEAFRRLDNMLSSVRQAVDHGHNFRNKEDWYKELDALAYADRDWLGKLYEPIKRIAWRVRDQSFNHEQSDSINYCCDELIMDLSLLQLKLLPLIPMRRSRREATARGLAESVLLCWHGVSLTDMTEEVEKFLKHWEEGKVTVDSKYAMSCVLGTGNNVPEPE